MLIGKPAPPIAASISLVLAVAGAALPALRAAATPPATSLRQE